MTLLAQFPHMTTEQRRAIMAHIHENGLGIVGASVADTLQRAKAVGIIGKKTTQFATVAPTPKALHASRAKPHVTTTVSFIGTHRVEVDDGDEPEPEPDDYDEPLELSDLEEGDETSTQEIHMTDETKQNKAEQKLQEMKGEAEASASPRTRNIMLRAPFMRDVASADDIADAEALLAKTKAEALASSSAKKAGR